jgi:hypothetical protein
MLILCETTLCAHWGESDMTEVAQDLRIALRQLRRSPGFAATAILTLALGIGANTAIFSALNATLLKLLPVRDPQQFIYGSARQRRHAAPQHSGHRPWQYILFLSGIPGTPAKDKCVSRLDRAHSA